MNTAMTTQKMANRPPESQTSGGEVVSSGVSVSPLSKFAERIKEGINKKIDEARSKLPIVIEKQDVEYEIDEQNNQIIIKYLDLIITIDVQELERYEYWTLEFETETAKAYVSSSNLSYEDDELTIEYKPKKVEEDPIELTNEEELIEEISKLLIHYWMDGDFALAEYINSFYFG